MKKNKHPPASQAGTALITAILITAIMAALSIAIISQQHLFIENQIAANTNQRAYNYMQGTEDTAASMVRQYGTEQAKNPEGKEFAANRLATHRLVKLKIPVFYGATMRAVLSDQQALYNINNLKLSSGTEIKNFSHFLTQADPNLSPDEALNLTKDILDWMTLGKNDSYYASLKPPYSSAHHTMASIKELLLVHGMTPDIYRRIAPYITALPLPSTNTTKTKTKTKININTAPAMVLTATSASLDLAQARTIIACRKSKGFLTSKNLTKPCDSSPFTLDSSSVTYYSHYFLLRATINLGDQQHQLSSLITFVNLPKQTTIKQSWLVWQTWS